MVAGNVPVRASFSTLSRSSTYDEKLTYLAQIYFYTLHPNAYAIEMEARQPRFEQQTIAYHKLPEIGPSQNLCIEFIGGKLLLQLCAGMAPAITWATQPGT